MNSKTTIDEDLLSRLRYTRSRLEDSEISTDAVEQIDDELEVTTASLNKKLQVSIGSEPDSDQCNPHEKSQLIIPPKPEQTFKNLLRKQIKSIQKDSKVVIMNDNSEMIPMSNTPNCNFATINKTHLRLMKSSPPKIPIQPVSVIPPVPPSIICSSNTSTKPKLTTVKIDTSAVPIDQAQQELSLYPNGLPPPLKNHEPLRSSQSGNQDRDVVTNNNVHTNPHGISSSYSEYFTKNHHSKDTIATHTNELVNAKMYMYIHFHTAMTSVNMS